MIVMKKEVYTHKFIENRRLDTPDRAVWGSTRVGQRQKREEKSVAQSLYWGFCGGRNGRHSGVGTLSKLHLGLDSLNAFAGLWAIVAVLSHLAPGPGVI